MRSLSFAVFGLLTMSAWSADPVTFPKTLPGTAALTLDQPLDEVMVAGIDKFALQEIAAAREARAARWQRDLSSPEAYQQSLAPYREKLRTYLGAVDLRVVGRGLENLELTNITGKSSPGTRRPRKSSERYSALPARWQVFQNVTAEGIILYPAEDEIVGLVVAIPDATWSPEVFCGADPNQPEACPLARSLVEQGLLVIIPTLLSRDDTHAGNPDIVLTNQSHREWVYRQAFEVGRHMIGYEVQKVLAAVDALETFNKELQQDLPIGVAGVGDGGLLAMHASALDSRIDATWVAGYFQPREGVWDEPIDRNVWRLLGEFGDAEVAAMIAPRPLVIETAKVPEVITPLPVKPGRRGGAAPGKIQTATVEDVRSEFARLSPIYAGLKAADKVTLIDGTPNGNAGSVSALAAFLNGLGVKAEAIGESEPVKLDTPVDADARQLRQMNELVAHTQRILQLSFRTRDKLWAGADRSSVDKWTASAEKYRNLVWDELIGRLPNKVVAPSPRTRKILETPEYHGYEVVLDVFPDVIASGILLLPNNLKEGEKRPVVVCQHGLEGVPMDTISGPGSSGYPPYKAFSAELARRGFIVYAPQNPYRGKDKFRTLQRKSNPLGRSLFSYILPQHQVTLDWLKTLPNADPQRLAFYGLSYGGKTAVRVPPLLTDYCLSICSADYNEWVYKNATIDTGMSYVFTGEYEIFEWNMGHVANYAELSYLMTPRPFMVERGHDDGVSVDELVAYEYAKVRRHYSKLGLGDKTEIEFFNGPHTINGQATYEFLHRHLSWPKK